MPRYTRPAHSEHAEDPINALGNRVRAKFIGYPREHPDALRAEITAALDIPNVTTAKALATLVEYGQVVPDPPRETRRGVNGSVTGWTPHRSVSSICS